MQNGKHEDKLDRALEDTFPGSDPVAITQPETREGAPKRNGRSAAQAAEDIAGPLRRIKPDYLWLGGAFVLGCVIGIAAGAAPSLARRSYGERLLDTGEEWQRRLSGRVSDLQLQRKLSELIDRLR